LTSTFFAVSVFGADFGADFFFHLSFWFLHLSSRLYQKWQLLFFLLLSLLSLRVVFSSILRQICYILQFVFWFSAIFLFFGFVLFFSSKSLFSNQTLNFWSFTSVFAFGVGPSSFDDSLF